MESTRRVHRQWIASIAVTLSRFTYGMFVGWPSPSLRLLRSPTHPLHLTEEQISWMVSLQYLGSVLSPVPTSWLMNAIGRKTALMALTSVSLASWVILITVETTSGVYLARFLGGMWGGSVYAITPIYLCEIADKDVRGALNTLFLLMIYLGIMFEYVIGPYVSYIQLSIVSALVSLVFLIAMMFVPESPYFYLMKRDRNKAARSLAWLHCKTDLSQVEEELTVLEKAVAADMENRGRLVDLVSTAASRKALLITETIAVIQRMSGISVAFSYASTVIPQVGLLSSDDCVMIVCLVWIVFGFLATFLVAWFGLRSLLAVSCVGSAIGNAMIAGWLYLNYNTDYDAMNIAWFQFASFILFSVFFTIGLGIVPGRIQGELFPTNTRGLASGITSVFVSFTSFVTNKIFHGIGEAYGLYLNFVIFSISCIFGVYFALSVVIETKDKTLQEIQLELVKRTANTRIRTSFSSQNNTGTNEEISDKENIRL